MTEKERNATKRLTDICKLLRDTSKDSQIKERFLEEFGTEVVQTHEYLLNLLSDSYDAKNAEDIGYCLFIGFVFDLYSNCFVDLLCKLLEADWHYSHEDIASILQKLKSPYSVNSLYQATLANHQYLECSDVSPLAMKCIWALGEILTDESTDKLNLLAQSDNEIIKENAIMQLGKR